MDHTHGKGFHLARLGSYVSCGVTIVELPGVSVSKPQEGDLRGRWDV